MMRSDAGPGESRHPHVAKAIVGLCATGLTKAMSGPKMPGHRSSGERSALKRKRALHSSPELLTDSLRDCSIKQLTDNWIDVAAAHPPSEPERSKLDEQLAHRLIGEGTRN